MTSNHDTQTTPGARAGVIKLGLDVHASSIVVVRQIDAQPAQPAQRLTPEQFPAFERAKGVRASKRASKRSEQKGSCFTFYLDALNGLG